MMRLLAIIALIMLCCAPGALAQSKKPLEITADGTLEWDRNKQVFTANQNAMAKQGLVSLSAAVISALYNDSGNENMNIHTLTAENDVIIRNQDSAAYGDKVVYDVNEGLATMTGENLRMASVDQTLTANENFQYWTEDGRLVANGRAKIIRGTDTLEADTITATFKDEGGKRVLDRMDATGNVVITTPSETLTGTHGTYTARTNMAEITGNVKISRGPNVLEGSKAEVDLTTSISRMYGSAANGGRVRGVFYPDSQ